MSELSNNSSDFRVWQDVNFEAVRSAVESKVTTLAIIILVYYYKEMQTGISLFHALAFGLFTSQWKWTPK